MSTHQNIDRICILALVLSLLLTVVFVNGEALGIQAAEPVMGYETRLFDTSQVHTIDIVIDDWEGFLSTAQSEEYSVCSVVIDGEAYKNVGIRGKGNTSLSTVSSMDSERYSFKIEFDQYETGKTYHGLDKLSLNNLIQDSTYMKDYLTYRMMNEFGAAAPLCSYVYITVNGEDWGLYLAVEGVEDAFLQRNYGSDHGELYKPDGMDMGGGRGNGKDFRMEDFMASAGDAAATDAMTGGTGGRNFGGFSLDIDEDALRAALEEQGIDPSILDGIDFDTLDLHAVQDVLRQLEGADLQALLAAVMGSGAIRMPDADDRGGMDFGGMGSGDAKLQYIDEDPASYSTIFDSAKTDVTEADQTRLIASLQALSRGDVETSLDVDAVLRYFVVHNFVVNGDSYTGSMIHNYYLYEEDGLLTMIPWDYNLAFGTFQGSNAASAVNDDIDRPLSVTVSGDRPMADWIFQSEEYTALYHQYFAEFLETVEITALIDEAAALIAPYVAQDPTAFYTYEEFEQGAAALREFCQLRRESVQNQLNGSGETVDASHLNLSDMGTMSMGGRGGGWTQESDSAAPQLPEGTAPPNGFSGGFRGTTPGAQPSAQGGTMPPGMNGGFPGAMPGTQAGSTTDQAPDMPQMPQDTPTSTPGGSSAILLLVSAAVLALGLLFAGFYKHRR